VVKDDIDCLASVDFAHKSRRAPGAGGTSRQTTAPASAATAVTRSVPLHSQFVPSWRVSSPMGAVPGSRRMNATSGPPR